MNELTTENKSVNNYPTLLPEISKKELYNMIQNVDPISELIGQEFKILGLMSEYVTVSKDMDGNQIENEQKQKIILITDKKVYQSFSLTFNKAIENIFTIFGDEVQENTYFLKTKLKNGKNYYVVEVL